MKKMLFTLVIFCSLLTVNLNASEIGMSKQDMLRTAEPAESEIINMDEQQVSESRGLLAIVLATILILVIVGLLSTFVTKYALSIREKNNSIYQKDNKKLPKDSE